MSERANTRMALLLEFARGRSCLVLLAASVPILVFKLGSYSFVNGDEALYHTVAETMVLTGDWLQIDFRTEPRVYDTFMNAPLQYWLRASLILLFGSNLWTARITSALFGVATVWLVHHIARSWKGPLAGLLAGGILLTTLQFVFLHSARTGELETLVSFLMLAAAWFFLRALERGEGFGWHHACLALLANVKLPLVALPLLAELPLLLLSPTARSRLWRFCWTGLLMAPLALTWHIAQALSLGEPAAEVLATMFGQARGSVGAGSGPVENLQYYARVVAFGCYPYAFAYPLVLLASRRFDAGPQRLRFVLVGLYVGAVFGFFALVSKHAPWYVIPAYPFLSLLLGCWLAEGIERGLGRAEVFGIAVAAALVLGSTVAPARFNPFALPAVHMPMQLGWRGFGPLGSALGIVATSLLLLSAAIFLQRRLGPVFQRRLAAGFCVLLLAAGLLRTVLPLRHLEHQSQLALLRAEVDRRNAAGEPLPLPTALPGNNLWLIRTYFGEEFGIALAPGGAATGRSGRPLFQLVEKR